MGSSSSRMGSGSSRSWVNRRSSSRLPFLICGGSSSHAPSEMEDYPAELLAQHRDQVNTEAQNSIEECSVILGAGSGFTSPHIEIGTSSESSPLASEDTFNNSTRNAETNDQVKCLSESKGLLPPHQVIADHRHDESYIDRSRTMDYTSLKEQQSSLPLTINSLATKDAVNGIDNSVNQGVSQMCPDLMCPSSSSPQGIRDPCSSGENCLDEIIDVHNSDSNVVPDVSDSSVVFHSLGDESLQEAIPSGLGILVSNRERGQGDGNVLHVDLVSISSNSLSSGNTDTSSRETRSGRRLFWDSFSRRSSRRLGDSASVVFATDDTDDRETHDRWLLDFGGEFFDEGPGGNSGYLGSLNERRRHSRSEIWERLRSGLNENGRRNAICPSGLHPDGRCSCESSSLMTEESSTRASISRIVMLAEALFEVLDEIHRVPLSLSMISMPAPESVVDSFPLRNYKKLDISDGTDDVEQCYICLDEYEEGDKIRVLPCHHEYHMSCVDKWLKEIHGVCPLCRGDVRGAVSQCSVSNSEISSL